ncbi:CNH domain-containing protein [Mycena olivaceomarginata]|nr:CNH domain-containing protein [Mycena olivaceomarginata]
MSAFVAVALIERFSPPKKVNCAALFNHNNERRIVYGLDDGVYMSDVKETGKEPTKVLALVDVSQVDVLEDYRLLVVLSEGQVLTFLLDTLDPMDPVAGLKRTSRISVNTSFFKVGYCLGQPIEQTSRGRVNPTSKKLLPVGVGYYTLKPFREFFIPVESTSIHYLKTRMCIACSRGFEVIDLESLETHGLLDPSDKSLNFVLKPKRTLPFFTSPRVLPCPMAIYRIHTEFLLCYNGEARSLRYVGLLAEVSWIEFAFYIDKSGRRSRSEFMISWDGKPTGFDIGRINARTNNAIALHWPYILAFSPSFVEIRHVESGLIFQTIPGPSIRLLFANTPWSVDVNGGTISPGQRPDQLQPGIGTDDILMVSEDHVLAVRLRATDSQD